MKDNFDHAMKFILFWEKWKSNDLSDPGGLTIWGITSRWFPSVIETLNMMSEEESKKFAIKFYHQQFWDKIHGDKLPSLFDIVIMDCAVNQGIDRALKIAKDADIGDWKDCIIQRLDRYDDLNRAELPGWTRRLVSLWGYIHSNFKVLKWD